MFRLPIYPIIDLWERTDILTKGHIWENPFDPDHRFPRYPWLYE